MSTRLQAKPKAPSTLVPSPAAQSRGLVSARSTVPDARSSLLDARADRLTGPLPFVQTKLVLDRPGDRYEQEADRVAEAVMRTPEARVQRRADGGESEEVLQAEPVVGSISTLVQRQPEPEPEDEDEEPIQAKLADGVHVQRQEEDADDDEEEEPVQAKSAGAGAAALDPSTEAQIRSLRGQGRPIDPGTRGFMESQLGHDFSRVRVHTGVRATQATQALRARAFTVGRDVVLGTGAGALESTAGRRLLAHELAHVVQQGASAGEVVRRQPKPGAGSGVAVVEREPEERDSSQRSEPDAAPSASTATVEQGVEGVGSSDTAEVRSVETADQGETSEGERTENETGSAPSPEGERSARSPASPEEDAEFQAVVGRVKEAAARERGHRPAGAEAAAAQAAAVGPANEVQGKAQERQVQQMAKQQPGAFDAAALKAALRPKIAAVAPKTLEEADQFKAKNKIGAVKADLSSTAERQQRQTQQPIEQTTKAPPDTTGIKPKPVVPLPPAAIGSSAGGIAAAGAAPKPKTDAEISLQEGSGQLDAKMADAQITDEQLQKANEPSFQAALDAKQKAQGHAGEAPQAFRAAEQTVLSAAQAQAETGAKAGVDGMHADRGRLLKQAFGAQSQAKGGDESARAKVTGEVSRIYQTTRRDVERILDALGGEVGQMFDAGASDAQRTFESYVGRQMAAYKEERYGKIFGWARWVKDKLLGMPPEVNRFYAAGRDLYLERMDRVLDAVVGRIAGRLNEAKARIAQGRQEIQRYVEGLPAELKRVGSEAVQNIQARFDELEQGVDDKQNELIDTLARRYKEKLQTVDTRIEEMKAENRGVVDAAMGAVAGVVETIRGLRDMLLNALSKQAALIGRIIADPIGFLGNFVTGLKQGFQNFVANILTHLKTGLIVWLTGALGPTGIEMPRNLLSLRGIFGLVVSVLGLTWDYIRRKAVKLLGERAVRTLEATAGVLRILKTGGAAGLWQYVKDRFGDLKGMVMEQIRSMLVTQVITAGVKWILSMLNPVAAFIKAAMAIYNIVMFFIERGRLVLPLVTAIIDAVGACASGAAGVAAKLVEGALASAVPVVIGFLASLLGITGLAKRVQAIIQKLRTRIEKAIDWVIVKARRGVGRLLRGKGGAKQAGRGRDEQVRTGLAAIDREERRYLAEGAISRADAQRVAATVRRAHPVFASIAIVDGGETWDYEYVASPKKRKKGEGQAKCYRVHLHTVSPPKGRKKGDGQSHHVPPVVLLRAIGELYKERGAVYAQDLRAPKLAKTLTKRGEECAEGALKGGHGEGLSAIWLTTADHKQAHKRLPDTFDASGLDELIVPKTKRGKFSTRAQMATYRRSVDAAMDEAEMSKAQELRTSLRQTAKKMFKGSLRLGTKAVALVVRGRKRVVDEAGIGELEQRADNSWKKYLRRIA